MKVETTKQKILNAVQIAERVVGKKESLPVLSCVFIDAGNRDRVLLKATNLEAGVEVVVPCSVEDRGVVAVPSSVLLHTIRSISSDKVLFRTEEGNLIVESRGTKTLIKAVPHAEFPVFGEVGGGEKKKLSKNDILRGVHSVSYAASPSMIRPELGSVYISLRPGEVVYVATDSFRLAEKIVVSGKKEGAGDILLPLKHAMELVHVLENTAPDDVEVVVDDSQMVVFADGVKYVSRVVDGIFPNYKEIVPKSFETEATILKNDFSEMLRKARVFSGNDQHVGLHVYPKKKIFSATARSADVGEMSDSIDAALSGEDIDINFHIGYLADCLPTIEADSITLGFAGTGKPLVIRGVSDTSFMYLVMPLNR